MITRSEKQVLLAINQFLEHNVEYPSCKDIGAIAEKDQHNVYIYIKKLESKGYVKVDRSVFKLHRKRIEITDLGRNFINDLNKQHEN